MTEPFHADPSHEVPEWDRERIDRSRFEPSKRLLAAIRKYQRYRHATDPISKMKRRAAVAEHRFWSAICACDIPINTEIAGGLVLPHPTGIVVHPDARIGPNCLLFQNVTLGGVERATELPVLAGGVDVGAGAKILGPVHIGHYARIGANAVVVTDVPPFSIAVGIPAKVRPRTLDDDDRRSTVDDLDPAL